MFRRIAFVLEVIALSLPIAAAAQMPVPHGVNLHNGYIEVINNVQYHDGFRVAGVVNLNDKTVGEVSSPGTLVVNHCCILAGSHYIVELNYMSWAGARLPIAVVPRMCTIRGIPFGYAVVEFTGDIRKTRVGSGSPTHFEIFNFRKRRIDTGCPFER